MKVVYAYDGLRQRPDYAKLANYLQNDQEIVKYPNRIAKQLRESPYLTQLDGEGYLEMQDQQQKIMKAQQREQEIRRRASEINQAAQFFRANIFTPPASGFQTPRETATPPREHMQTPQGQPATYTPMDTPYSDAVMEDVEQRFAESRENEIATRIAIRQAVDEMLGTQPGEAPYITTNLRRSTGNDSETYAPQRFDGEPTRQQALDEQRERSDKQSQALPLATSSSSGVAAQPKAPTRQSSSSGTAQPKAPTGQSSSGAASLGRPAPSSRAAGADEAAGPAIPKKDIPTKKKDKASNSRSAEDRRYKINPDRVSLQVIRETFVEAHNQNRISKNTFNTYLKLFKNHQQNTSPGKVETWQELRALWKKHIWKQSHA